MYKECDTGCKTRRDESLFEGMKVRFRPGFKRPEETGIIVFDSGKFIIRWDSNESDFSYIWSPTILKTIEII